MLVAAQSNEWRENGFEERDVTNSINTLYYTRCAVPTPLGIAARLGWFKDEFADDGIEVKVVVESESVTAREAHYDHSVDNLFRLGGSVPALWARGNGRATRLLALSWVDEFQAIVSLPESRIAAARDLRGRRLGLPQHRSPFIDHERASALRGFASALGTEGLSLDDVQLVDIEETRNSIAEQGDAPISGSKFQGPRRKPGHRPLQALIRGEVDALYVKGPRGLQLVHQLGLHVSVDLGSHPDPLVRANNCTPRTFTVDEQLLRARPDLVRRVVSRVIDAGVWARTHAEEAVRFIGIETATAESWVRYGYGSDVHLSLGIDLSERSIRALADFKQFLVQHDFIGDFDLSDWIAPEPLHEAAEQHARRVA